MTELDNTEHIEQTPAADVQETVTATRLQRQRL